MDSPWGWIWVDSHMWDKGAPLVPKPWQWSLTVI